MKNKEPWLAVNLSKIFPGLGQIYSGNKIRGYLIILICIATQIIASYIIISPTGNVLIGVGFFLISFIIGIWNLFDAYNCVKKKNNQDFEYSRQQNKDPWKAMFLSQLFLGIGHFYIGKWLFGIFAVILIIISSLAPGLLSAVTSSIVIAWIAYLAYVFAPVKRENSKNLAFVVAIFILISTMFSAALPYINREYFIEARWIPSGAMEPTLHGTPNLWEADRILVDKSIYRFQAPQRGDIIVFKPTEELQKENFQDAFIKRIVGLPGEKIELKDGKVYINNQQLPEDKYLAKGQLTFVDVCASSPQPAYLANKVTIPDNSYLALGDNRTQSYDGRCWGVVPREFIIGKAFKRWFPLNRISGL
ncbi:hypothetical protein CAL7716_082480 [Calothrix sp. PCC 7716]|nr:hypothetical protein CAL7716_082480 [Calothrix sp. PCC 7716]